MTELDLYWMSKQHYTSNDTQVSFLCILFFSLSLFYFVQFVQFMQKYCRLNDIHIIFISFIRSVTLLSVVLLPTDCEIKCQKKKKVKLCKNERNEQRRYKKEQIVCVQLILRSVVRPRKSKKKQIQTVYTKSKHVIEHLVAGHSIAA